MAEQRSVSGYRFYSFTNMYLSPMQKGIQTAHAVSEMSAKYLSKIEEFAGKDFRNEHSAFTVWAELDKTVIVLNGGYSSNLRSIYKTCKKFCKELRNGGAGLPVVRFYESDDALDNALTAVGIILPEVVYTTAAAIRRGEYVMDAHSFSQAEMDFYNMLNSCSLAT